MPKLIIDGAEVEVPDGATVLQACQMAGKEIPHFCYHERLSVAGNCRMCLVEMEKAPKPIASCAMPAGEGMVITTDSETVRHAREGVMEFLLINHPLDCPICDQGGECDLQDQAMAYGGDRTRYEENKRAVVDKNMGPLVKTVMTRCIHCTRCVRFATEIAGVSELGMLGRGEHAEITSYLEESLSSELSANIIDLCPVGALTSKPYAFAARPWELRKTESVDVLDAVGSAIRVDARGASVLRVMPRLNEDVNEEWIADKTRFACDGLRRQRLDQPLIRRDGKLEPADWTTAFEVIAERLADVPGNRIAAIAGDLCDAESMLALKNLMGNLGSKNIDCRQDGAKLDAGVRGGYVLNSTIAGLETANAILLVGTNPRHEAPLVNMRIRRAWLENGAAIGTIGATPDLTYPVEMLGAGPDSLADLVPGGSGFFQTMKDADRAAIIVGMGALARPDGRAILSATRNIAVQTDMIDEDWNGFNVLHTAAARVGGLDLGFVPGDGGLDVEGILSAAQAGSLDVLYLLAADEIDISKLNVPGKSPFVIYQGHHGDAGAHRADVVLPGAASTEKHGTYVNTEGRVQLGRPATTPPGDAREDWKILRAMSEHMGETLPYDSLGEVRSALVVANPIFDQVDQAPLAAWGEFGADGSMDAAAFKPVISDYYLTDPISRASETMAECSREFAVGAERTGTDG
jgi:NADH-quinone oxidoreductase subunit G